MCQYTCIVKPVYNGHSKKDRNLVFKTNARLMQFKSIEDCFKGLPFVIKFFVLSIFEWQFYTGITVLIFSLICMWMLKLFVCLQPNDALTLLGH